MPCCILCLAPWLIAQPSRQTFRKLRGPKRQAGRPAGTLALLRRLEYLLVAVVLLGFLDTLRFAVYYIPLRFAVNFEEGNVLNAALRITRGQSPYPPVGGLPYVVNPYGPVFYYAVAPLVKWFGLNFTAPRLLVLASGFAVSLFVILLLKRWTGSWRIALGFGLSFLAVTLVRDWIYVLRVDIFGAALTMAGLYVFATRRSPIGSALLFVAGLFTKITLLAAPVACIFYLALSGERRRAWRLTAWMTAFGTLGLIALGWGTRGWGLFNMFLTHPDPYSISRYWNTIRPFALLDAALLAGAIALAARDIRRRQFSLPLLYFLLASVMTLTAGKLGSDANHLIEWQAAMCLAAGCGYYALRQRPRPDPVVALIPIGIIVLVLLGLPESRQLNPELQGCQAAYQFAAGQPGQLLTGNPGAAVLSGKKVWLSNTFEYAFLGKDGRLDQQPLIRMVLDKSFGLILIDENIPALEMDAAHPRAANSFWPPGFVAALLQNYHPVARFSCAYADVAYEPNPPPRPRAVPAR
ncbi:MAG TPA: hypothetical protein VNJ52_10605 [Patescibacteria group bacterium]|nr:hypothetical protein [Patescibacteria group bacterium]